MNSHPRVNVLQVGKYYPPFMGGIETHLKLLCDSLRDRIDLRVLVSNDGRETIKESVDGVSVTRLGTALHVAAAPISPGMARCFRQSGADILHLHHPNPGPMVALVTSRFRGRVVITYHSDIVRQKLLGKAFAPFLNWSMKRADAVIATSTNYLASSPVLQVFKDKVKVIPYGNPMPVNEAEHRAEAQRIRAQYGPRILIAVGRLIYYKGFEYLIRAMKHVPAKLLLVGDGPLRDTLEQEARDNGVQDRVIFTGSIQNARMAPYYQAADIFVLPSIARSEAFAIVQIEAMASEKPVINTSLDSGVPYVSLHEVSGLTVPPKDSETLAKAINLLLDSPDLCERYGRAGRKRVLENFTSEVMTERTMQLYEEVMAKPVAV